MQQTDCIVVGLGIAGTLVSYELWKAGLSFIVIDDTAPSKASLVAGAVINPYNIKQWKTITHSDEYLPVALETYQQLEQLLACKLLHKKTMLVQAESAVTDEPLHVSSIAKTPAKEQQTYLNKVFKNNKGFLEIENLWQVDATLLYQQWRQFLQQRNLLLEEQLQYENCDIQQDQILYKNIQAKKIIYCEGASAAANPLFHKLPFTRNRGEALLLSIPQLNPGFIYQHNARLVPANNNLFWFGSNYVWQYDDLLPDETWKAKTIDWLTHWLNIPFSVSNHIVAERPTTAGQFPLVGIHPAHSAVAILNGLGTKGFSLGPILAHHLVQLCIGSVTKNLSHIIKPLNHWLN